MSFGLTSTLATFQHFINNVLQDFLNQFVIAYLHNILILSKDPNQHSIHIQEMLERLYQHSLFANGVKCALNQTTVESLGLIVSPSNGLPEGVDHLRTEHVLECEITPKFPRVL